MLSKNQSLILLQEECAEVVQIIAKIYRYGEDSCHPSQPNYTNQQRLEDELGHVVAAIGNLSQRRYINTDRSITSCIQKEEKYKLGIGLFV